MLFQSEPVTRRPTAGPELGCYNRAEIEARGFSDRKSSNASRIAESRAASM
jgi:hypothetical protein